MNYEDYVPVKIWSEMLEAGVPDLHVRYQVETHINALEALPDDTPDKQSALEHSKLFLSALKPSEEQSLAEPTKGKPNEQQTYQSTNPQDLPRCWLYRQARRNRS